MKDQKNGQSQNPVIAIVLDGLMTVSEAMKFLQVSRTTLYKLMDEGHLEWVKIGTKTRRLPRRAVVEFAARNVCGGWAKRAV